MPHSLVCDQDQDEGRVSDAELIRDVQQYLHQKSRHEHPSASLIVAWCRFYRDYSPLVRQVVSRSVPRAADQDDCFQHVWMSLLLLLPRLKFDPKRGSFRGWLSTVTQRLARQFVQKLDRQRAPVCVPIPEWDETVDFRVSGPLQELQQSEQVELVHRVLKQLQARLSLPSYRVFHLRWIEGQSYDEIARQLHLTSRQVRWRHHSAKQKAAKLMACSGQFPPD
jgi:RNA polymerase sigma-70 factor (ECF subfamily)